MRKLMVGIAVLMVSSVVWCGEGSQLEKIVKKDKTLQRNVKKVTVKMEKEDKKLAEAQKKHKESITKLKKELMGVYEASMKKYTKKGDIRAATVIMEQVDKMKKDVYMKPTTSSVVIYSKSGKIGILSNGTKLFSNRNYKVTQVNKKLRGMKFIVLPCKENISYEVMVNTKQKIYVLTHQTDSLDGWEKEEKNLIKHDFPEKINIYVKIINGSFKIQSHPLMTPIVIANKLEIKNSTPH